MNSAENRAKLIEKIQKLMALAGNNPSEEEAMRALEKASALMAENAIFESDLFENRTAAEIAANIFNSKFAENLSLWETELLQAVVYLFDCRVYFTKKQISTEYYIVGFESNLCFVREMWSELTTIIRAMSSMSTFAAARTKKQLCEMQFDYCRGFARRIHTRAWEIVETRKMSANNSTAIMCLKQNAVEKYMKEELNVVYTKQKKHTVNVNAYNQGYRDGGNVTLQETLK